MATKNGSELASPRVKLDEFPAYVAAVDRLNELKAARMRLDERVSHAIAHFRREQGGHPAARAAAALALTTAAAGDPSGGDEPTFSADQINALVEERATVDEAIRLQQRIVDKECAVASREIAQNLRPQHAQLVRRVIAAVVELAAACEAERRFRDELHEADVSYLSAIVPLSFGNPGRLSDLNGNAVRFFREAVEAGYLDLKSLGALGIPAETVNALAVMLHPPEKRPSITNRLMKAAADGWLS